MTHHIHHNEPGAPTRTPHQTPERDSKPQGSGAVPRTAREGAHRQTGPGTAPDPAREVSDPHPPEEGHPYDTTSPGGDTAPPTDVERGRKNIGPNPARHSGHAPPRPGR